MIRPSFSLRDRRIFAALWRKSALLAGASSRHFSNAFLAFSTDFSTSVRVDARNLLRTLPFAGFTVSIHRLASFAAKKNHSRSHKSAQDSYKLHRRSTAFQSSESNRCGLVKEQAIESDSHIAFRIDAGIASRIRSWNSLLKSLSETDTGFYSRNRYQIR